MEFDMSKENIQPLRGGRNRVQLEVALQAQADTELQKELLQNKQKFENSIRTYEGDDPLDNWYNYISWVEQSYPKHGHEGNLISLLEDCLAKFENEEQYIHDRRHCKLWIKYIDLQKNPDELFQLLHSKEICASCSDLYRAWAFYHEIAGDFKRANAVYQLGLQAMAQPYEELVLAQKNMFMAAGKHMRQEDGYEQKLEEQRHALTSLRTYKHKYRATVPSVRVGHQVLKLTPGSLPVTLKTSPKSNSNFIVHTDENNAGSSACIRGTVKSIIDVARSQEAVKENTLKPGIWTKLKSKKRTPGSSHHLTPSFTVHEDEVPAAISPNVLHLYPNFCPTNLDDFSDWKIEMNLPEPEDNRKIPMYPKQKVYNNNKEMSLEEIIAQKYLHKNFKRLTTTLKNIPITDVATCLVSSEDKPNDVNNELSCKINKDTFTPSKKYDTELSYSREMKMNNRKLVTDKPLLNKNEMSTSDKTVIYEDNAAGCSSQNTANGVSMKNLTTNIKGNGTIKKINMKIPSKYLHEKSLQKPSHNVVKDNLLIYEEPSLQINIKTAIDTTDFNMYANKQEENFTVFEDEASGYTLPIQTPVQTSKLSFSIFDDSEHQEDTKLIKTGTNISENMSKRHESLKQSSSKKPMFNLFSDSVKSTLENTITSIYKEENSAILSKDVNITLNRDKAYKKVNIDLKEHVRSLITPHSSQEGSGEIVKVTFLQPHQ